MRPIPSQAAIAFAATAILAAPSQAAERRFDVPAFQRIAHGGVAEVIVRTGPSRSVVAEGPEAALDRLEVRVEGDRLQLSERRGWTWFQAVRPLRIVVTTPEPLVAARAAGSGSMSIDRTGPSFEGSVAGSGRLMLGAVAADRLRLSVSGSGSVAGAGRCTEAEVRVSGSGSVRAADIVCRRADVAVSGSGRVGLTATERAQLRVSGSGHVDIAGGAACDSRVTGSGRVRCAGEVSRARS